MVFRAHEADDDYVRNALQYIRDNLAPGLKVHVEYSNEVWNWGYGQSKYARDKANELWGDGSGKDVAGGFMQYYGYRSAQVQAIAQDVFGGEAAERVVGVLGTQAFNNLTPSIIRGVEMSHAGAVSDLFSDYAITTYFGSGLNSSNANDRALVLSWARSGEAGVAAAFQELEYGGNMSFNDSLARVREIYNNHEQIAEKYGLNLVAYEGGAHMMASNYTGTDKAEVIAFYDRLMNDPRMSQLYSKMASDFVAAGGTEIAVYNDAGVSNGTFNQFGLLDNISPLSP